MGAKSELQYFWLLHSGVSPNLIENYQSLVKKHPCPVFSSWFKLFRAKIPVPPMIYGSPLLQQSLQKGDSPEILNEFKSALKQIEELTGSQFGGRIRPLLLSLTGSRCGSLKSFGMHQASLPALVQLYGVECAYSLYIEFLENFSHSVLGSRQIDFQEQFNSPADFNQLFQRGVSEFCEKIAEYQSRIDRESTLAFPHSPEQQLFLALRHFSRVLPHSEHHEISIQVQLHQVQYGQSLQGKLFTRNPFSGKRENVSAFREVQKFLNPIEAIFSSVMEVEFVTDETGRPYFTNFTPAQVSTRAEVASTVQLNQEGILSDHEAILQLKPSHMEKLMCPTLNPKSKSNLKTLEGSGLPASAGCAVGHLFFTMEEALEFRHKAIQSGTDSRVILFLNKPTFSDISNFDKIQGLVTKTNGIASHSAVMARSRGLPCIVGYDALEIDPSGKVCKIQDQTLLSGTVVTIEASEAGKLYLGEGVTDRFSGQEELVQSLIQLVSRSRTRLESSLKVRININDASDAKLGIDLGAEGVGLYRTENLFLSAESIREMRNILFQDNPEHFKLSLKKLEEMQTQEFQKIFEVMGSRPVQVRLMDLSVQDFFPKNNQDLEEFLRQIPGMTVDKLYPRTAGAEERNPVLGFRGCRVGFVKPELYDFQIRALMKAAYAVQKSGTEINLGVLFPFVISEKECFELRKRVFEIEKQVRSQSNLHSQSSVQLRVGAMIELPAAALQADQLAKVGETFAFGTNDLTQTTLGMSRDDSSAYLPEYLKRDLMTSDPFEVLSAPVRELLDLAIQRGRRVRPNASFGICGEHSSDSSTLSFCIQKNLNYVSCSPSRVLGIQVSLLQLALKTPSGKGV